MIRRSAAVLCLAALLPSFPAAAQQNGIDFMRQVHAEYRKLYGAAMPIDVYVVHGYVTTDWSVAGFQDAMRRFRAFMKEQGLQQTPLWIKEFSPLAEPSTAVVETYMRGTVGFLRTASDPATGPSWDNGRLVQRWAWFVMQDGEAQYEGAWDNVALFDADTRVRKRLGDVYAELANRALVEDWPNPATRPASHFRFGVGSGINDPHTALANYDYHSLRIGWVFDWGASSPPPPDLDYMPLVAGWRPGAPSADAIRSLGAAYPSGTVWSVSNEISFDDGRTPRRYAQDYHDTYAAVKAGGAALGRSFYVATGAVLPTSPLYRAAVFRNADGRPDLYAVRKQLPGSPKTVVQIESSDDGFGTIRQDAGTILHPTGAAGGQAFDFGMGDWNRDGVPDLFAIKKQHTGQSRTEVHILNGADSYGSWLNQVATGLGETGDEAAFCVADWNRDGVPDVWYVKKCGTGSGRTEVHVLDGRGYQSFSLHQATALVPTGGEAAFAVADWNRDGVPDLWYIKKYWTGSNRTEVHILNGADGFRTFLLHIGTGLHETGAEADFAVADWDRDGVPDLWYVKKYGTGSGRTEVHILNGRDGFQTFLAHIASGVEPTGADDRFLAY